MNKKFLFLFTCLLLFFSANIVRAEERNYSAGTLIALDKPGATVYYIGEDGKKYIFPESKTYFTWYNNFDDVIKVTISELDKYPDGGIMPYKAGIKLITHQNTANVYAVEPNGVLRKIPSVEVAENLYGADWASMVQDVLPGYFAATYSIKNDLYDELPTGALVEEKGSGNIYYIYEGLKRLFISDEAFDDNGFDRDDILYVDDLSNYEMGRYIKNWEENLSYFNKDRLSKYSDYELLYTLSRPNFSSSIIIQLATTTPDGIPLEQRDIEIRKVVVKGHTPLRFNYKKDYYFDHFGEDLDGYNEFSEEYIKIDDFTKPLSIIPSNAGNFLFTDLKDWIIWDNVEDKQIVNIKSKTYY